MDNGDRTDKPKPALAVPDAGELGSLARELARGYAELVESHRRSWGVGAVEAESKAREHGEWAVQAARTDPPDQVNWWTLSTAMERDPEAALRAWERVKDEARKELATGHRTAQSLEWGRKPWDRARYLAIREAFAADWKPRGGVEAALLDLLAQSFSAYLIWTERLNLYHETQCQAEDTKQKSEGYWMPPRMGEARWLDWCAGQAEAAHRRFLATLKALHDLRRLPAVFVAGAGQVNVASQQVNVAAPAMTDPSRRRRRRTTPPCAGPSSAGGAASGVGHGADGRHPNANPRAPDGDPVDDGLHSVARSGGQGRTAKTVTDRGAR